METKISNLVMVEFSANVVWGVYKYTYILKITNSEDEAADIVESYMQIEAMQKTAFITEQNRIWVHIIQCVS